MCFSAILGVGSALIGASSAGKAADAQMAASDRQIELQREIYDDQKARFQPFYDSGLTAHDAYLYEMGLGDRPTIGGGPMEIETITSTGGSTGNKFRDFLGKNGRTETTQYQVGDRTFSNLEDAESYARANPVGGTEYGGYTKTPGYDFRLNEGLDAVQAGVGARHGLNSGASLKALSEYGQDYASSEYGNYMNRLAGLTDTGLGAAGMQATAANNYATGASNALANYGNAQAAGYIGQGNAWNQGLGNLAGAWQYGQQSGGGAAGMFDAPWASGGFGW